MRRIQECLSSKIKKKSFNYTYLYAHRFKLTTDSQNLQPLDGSKCWLEETTAGKETETLQG